MEYNSLSASDGCHLVYGATARPNSSSNICVLLMHGFSGTSEYFKHNTGPLSEHVWVVAPDMRGHGRSETSKGGYHVARLAADLRELIIHLRSQNDELRFVPVGCSIGAAVLWTYVELFGVNDFAGLVFVDQAPLQNRSDRGGWDESKAHYGCYDHATTLAAQNAWTHDREDAQRGLIEGCLGYYHPESKTTVSDKQKQEDFKFFNDISSQCGSGEWLALLIADHTAYDHREALELINVPTLVMMGRYSGCFSLDGMRESVRRVNSGHQKELARESVFECGHWLFFEDPDQFNKEIVDFVAAL